MNLQDCFAEILLAIFDALMNLITLGMWNTIRGDNVPDLKVKGE